MSTFSVALGNWLAARRRVVELREEEVEDPRQRLPQGADADAGEHHRRQLAAALAGDEHVGAGRAFRVRQHAVLLDDQRPSQRHHHQHAENAAGEGQHRDLVVVEVGRPVGRQEDQRGDREDDAAGDRFSGRSNGLDDVVLENRRAAELLEDRNRQHGNRDRGADREAGAQSQIDGRRAEQQSEEDADHDRLQREFGWRLRGRHVRLKRGRFRGSRGRFCGGSSHGAGY